MKFLVQLDREPGTTLILAVAPESIISSTQRQTRAFCLERNAAPTSFSVASGWTQADPGHSR
jgi:hypothetical protein